MINIVRDNDLLEIRIEGYDIIVLPDEIVAELYYEIRDFFDFPCTYD